MKRLIMATLALACVTAVFLTGHSQQPALAPVLRQTKVGAVNMCTLYMEYDKVRRLKSEIDADMAPLNKKKSQLEQTIQEWTRIAGSSDPDYSPETREMAVQVSLEARRQLEDLEQSVKSVMGKKVETMLVQLNNSMSQAIDTYARENGYHLVLQYGEPAQPLPELAAFKRKMTIVDQGGLVLAHASNEIDITQGVLQVLSSQAEE